MRAKPQLLIALVLVFAALACNFSGSSVDTAVAGGRALVSQAAAILTDTAETVATGGTLPSGGGPSDTPASTPIATVTPTIAPTVAPSPTSSPHLRVAFISGANPWLVEPPAAPFRLSTMTGVEGVYLSSDGARVAYTRRPSPDGPEEVRVVNSDGTGDRALLTSAQVGALEDPGGALYVDVNLLQWIPGAHKIFLTTRGQFEGPGLARYDDLFVVDADTGAVTTVFTAGNGGDPHPSPDGTKMAISRATFLSVADIDGSGIHSNVITFPAIKTYTESQFYPPVVWAVDSSRFGVIIPSEDPLAASPSGGIYIVDGSSGAAELASTLSGIFLLPSGILSPTLDRVGYLRPTADPNVKDSYVSALDGSAALHLGSDANTAVLSFAPDGQHFAYSVGAPTTVFIGSLTGGTLPVPGSVMRLTWVNNTQFVFSQGAMSSWTLQLGSISGSASPIASPTGDRTAFDLHE